MHSVAHVVLEPLFVGTGRIGLSIELENWCPTLTTVKRPSQGSPTEVGETLGIDQVSRDFSVSRESQSRETNFLSLSLSLGLEKSNFSVSVSVSVSSF